MCVCACVTTCCGPTAFCFICMQSICTYLQQQFTFCGYMWGNYGVVYEIIKLSLFNCAIANYQRVRERWASKEGSPASLMMRWNCLLAGFHPIGEEGGGPGGKLPLQTPSLPPPPLKN